MNQLNTSVLGNIHTAFAAARINKRMITGRHPEIGIRCLKKSLEFISFISDLISLTRCNFKAGTESITNPAICFRDTETRAYCFTYLD
jgi:hypothetical protein